MNCRTSTPVCQETTGNLAALAINQTSLDEITVPSGRRATDSSRVRALAGAMEAT